MKSSTQDKTSIISGIAILILAAVFSISLLLQLLGFASYSETSNPLLKLGTMIYSVYGFSSILIPVFFLIAGLSCFASNWTARKAFRLLTAIVPFFTSVLCENICRSIYEDPAGEFAGVKIAFVLITGLMLVIIELLAAGVIADKINKKTKSQKTEKAPEEKEIPSEDLGLKTKFSKMLSKVEKEDSDSDDSSELPDGESIFETEKAFVQEKTSEKTETVENSEEAVSEKTEEVLSGDDEDSDDSEEDDDEDFSMDTKPLLTDEEYAALTKTDAEPEEEVDEDDTLEWNNLPPAPETLPPEYDPEEYETAPESEEVPISSEEETSYENEEDNPFGAAAAIEQMVQNPEIISQKQKYSAQITLEDPEAEKEALESEKKNETVTPVKSKYESKINLEDVDPSEFYSEPVVDDFGNTTVELDDTPVAREESKEPEDPIIDDSFLETPEFDENEEIDIPKKPMYPKMGTRLSRFIEEDFTTSTTAEDEDNSPKENNIFSVASNVFSDMDKDIRVENGITPEPASRSLVDDLMDEDDEEDDEDDDFFSGAMIGAEDSDNETEDSEDSDGESENFDDETSETSEETDAEHDHEGATNLTPDELSDFFNAQQKENTPKTKTIEGNLPPKNSSRARKKGPYVIPSDLLTAYENDQYWIIDEGTKTAAIDLKNTLAEFNIEADVIGIKKGPVVTMFEILPAPGVKLSKIVALQDNIALSLAASSVRIVAPIPGKQAVGIEIPNRHRSIVGFRELIEQNLEEFKKMSIPVVLGKDILGKAQIMDLVKTPHLLIAGATGAGKSVCVNSIILSILYKRPADKVKLILVDPKVVELKLYNNIPHLLTPVITEPKKAFQALQYCLCEMERRYSMLDNMGVRDISSYNSRIEERHLAMEKLPYIVVIIDEFADLMATTGKELESTVARLTAMSRAVGIHLVLATQRPSVNVITGLIKANIPSRIAFMVASRTDSSIIIDSPGAEKLLGRGDMLYASAVDPNPVRIQGTFVSDEEVEAVVDYVKQFGEPDYIDDQIFIEEDDDQGDLFGNDVDLGEDPLYDEALQIVVQSGKASASYIQRRLKIGYNRAARLVEEMEERGIVGPPNGSKPREIIHIP